MIRKIAFSIAAISIASSVFAGRGVVFTASNDSAGNEVLVFKRDNNGKLTQSSSVPTGGLGTGAGLGNQGGLTLSADGRFLYAVNAGSDTLSVFRVWNDRLVFIQQVGSGCVMPLSVTQRGHLVYVLNEGSSASPGNIRGFWQAPWGALLAVPGAEANLSTAAPDVAQIQFSPTSPTLVVTEKSTNLIDVYKLDFWGRPESSAFQPSNGQTPFGFDFDRHGRLFVSEAFGGAADASAVSSYRIERDGDLEVISPSVGTTETAACWTVISKDNKYAYVTNTGSGSISGYRIANDGSIALLNADGVTASTGEGSMPVDAAFSEDGKFLYALGSGTHTLVGFRVQKNGQLTQVEEETGLPASANGLAAK